MENFLAYLAAGDIFISNINTSVTVFDDNWEKSCMSETNRDYKIKFMMIPNMSEGHLSGIQVLKLIAFQLWS